MFPKTVYTEIKNNIKSSSLSSSTHIKKICRQNDLAAFVYWLIMGIMFLFSDSGQPVRADKLQIMWFLFQANFAASFDFDLQNLNQFTTTFIT